MREFTNKSLWDKESQEWVEFYAIDGQEVDADTFSEQAEIEELATEDESECQCCKCSDSETCDEYVCTCDNGENNHDEEPEEDEICFCPDCVKEREEKLITECLDMVFDPDACVDCTIDKVLYTMFEFKMLGYGIARSEMKMFLED